MTIKSILQNFTEKGILPEAQADQILEFENSRPFSIHWELRTILFLGITMLTSGLGVLIYKNIDTIGHQVIIALIIALTTFCFYYTFKYRQPFRWDEVDHATKFSEYALLSGCTLFLILEGYLQFQYNFFGTEYGIAIFIPTIIFFFLAYRFDHRGVLSMAVTGLASWLGLTISPLAVLEKNDFTTPGLITTGIILGIVLCFLSWLSENRNLKKHFGFTYLLFGGNLASIAGLSGLFANEPKVLYFFVVIAISAYLVNYARQTHSLLFLLMGVIYGYIAVTYAAFIFLPSDVTAFLGIFYFLFTSVGVLFFLLNIKKILGLKK